MFDRDLQLPFKSFFHTTAGFRLHYLDEGQGPVVLLLHGNPTWCFFYRELIKTLRGSFRVIAPDYIGCGLSEHPPDVHFRARDRVDHLEALLDHLGVKNFSLVMHDWGGAIGTALAGRRIEAVEKIVYLNTTLTEVESLPDVIKRAHSPIIGPLLTKYTPQFLNLTTTFGVTKRLTPEVIAGYHYPYQTIASRTAICDFVADIPFRPSHPTYKDMLAFAEKLPELSRKPVQIIWGLRDPCFHGGMLKKVAEHFPDAEVIEISTASHLVLEDAPEIACPAIERFLKKTITIAARTQVDTARINTLYKSFLNSAKSQSASESLVIPETTSGSLSYRRVTFQELLALTNKYHRGLAEEGLQPGERVLMLVPPGEDFLALSYAVMGRGAIPIFVDPGMGRKNLVRCIADANPTAFIGSPKAHLLRLLAPTVFQNLKVTVMVSPRLSLLTRTTAYLRKLSPAPIPPSIAPDTCLIAFTSGATGTPKGVIFTNSMIEETLSIFSHCFGVKAGMRDLPLLPIFSIFTAALGATSIVPPINPAQPLSLNPEQLVRYIQDLAIDISFGSPTLWNKISDYCRDRAIQLPTMKKIFMAGAPVPKKILEKVQGIIPNGEACTPYGATEALPVTLVSAKDLLNSTEVTAVTGERGTAVGRCVLGVECRIIQCKNGPIASIEDAELMPTRQIGEIIVKGKNISPNYLNRTDATNLAKIADGETFWHRMGDVGYLDEEGWLYFCGRKVHTVDYHGKTYYSDPVERIFNDHTKVARSALIPLSEPEKLAIAIEPQPQFWPRSEDEKRRFAEELRDFSRADPLVDSIEKMFFFCKTFPVDSRHNAKILREQLSTWASDHMNEAS